MANTIEIFNSKFVKDKLVADSGIENTKNNFFNNQEEIKEFNVLQRKYISNINYSVPSNFAKFGSAEQYYKNAISYIDSEYPYDHSTKDKLNWVNSLNDLEYYIYSTEYPRSTGYATLSDERYINVFSHVKELTPETRLAYDTNFKYSLDTTLNLERGFTFEAWLRFEDSTQNTNVISISALTSSESGISTIEILTIDRVTGSTSTFQLSDLNNAHPLQTPIPDNEWHHYAFSVTNSTISLFVDGQLTEELTGIDVNPSLQTFIFIPLGLMIVPIYDYIPISADFDKSSVFKLGGYGKMSIDEARFWNGKRSVEKIGRYWFTNIDGNDFEDANNSSLIFYYKFNEGWDEEYQVLCLDYSGKDNEGYILDYLPECRSSGSAINESGIVEDIEKGDIIYKGLTYSTKVKDFYTVKVNAGIEYDETNIHLLYNKFPSWVLEQEEESEVKHLKQMIQIISSYFDDLYNKIYEVSQYKNIRYNTDKNKIYPFYDKILTSMGFDVTELFSNIDSIEKISSRSDINLFNDKIQKTKNNIFQNIYNNLSFILKSKGTEKSIKSLLRSYGVNEELVKVNLYSDGHVYDIVDRSKEVITKKKTINLQGNNCIFLAESAIEENSLLNYYTLENCIILPSSLKPITETTSSLFGIQNNPSPLDYSWSSSNYGYYVTIETDTQLGSRFVLYDNSLNASYSDYIENLYDNTAWNIAIRKKPAVDTLYGVSGSINYNIELYGVNKNRHIEQEFSCSLPMTASDGYIRYYTGARKEDIIGATEYNTGCKILYCNFWTDYLNNDVIINHNKDILNYGVDE